VTSQELPEIGTEGPIGDWSVALGTAILLQWDL
jgi:hypothetical protein